jgi:7-cyano-7-deazaguanine synthase
MSPGKWLAGRHDHHQRPARPGGGAAFRRARFHHGAGPGDQGGVPLLLPFLRLRPAPYPRAGIGRANAARWGAAEHLVLRLELDAIGGSALTAAGLAVPKDRQLAEAEPAGEIPITYVPGRNTIFLAYAAAWAEVLGARDIFIGVNAVDFSGYPDCRPDYLAALTAALNLGSKAGREGRPFRLQAPLLHLSKAEIIAQGRELGVDYSQTHSCYDPDSRHRPCGRCDACILRLRGFAAAGCPDPLSYQTRG